MKRVGIVGGGPGGLFTALLLQQRSSEGLQITLFEANGRLGGKIVTKRFTKAPVIYEAGAAELYQYGRDPLRVLIKNVLGLATVPMIGNTVVLEDRILRNTKDIRRHYGKKTVRALKDFHKWSCSRRSFQQFYDSGWPKDNRHPLVKQSLEAVLAKVPDEPARHYLKTLIHSDLATEPTVTNGLFGLENYLINDRDYCKLYTIAGGLERLVEALQKHISAEIRLQAPAAYVEKAGAESYRLVWHAEGRKQEELFDAVVLALPNYWLPTIRYGGLLAEAMARHHAYYDHPAHYLRVSVLFQAPFWRDVIPDSYFHLDALGGCCVYDEGARYDAGPHGVLSWLLGGSHALAMNNHADEYLIEQALDSLPRELASGRTLFLEGHVHRWIGSVTGQPGGKRLRGSKSRHRPEPKQHPGLVVVGDYLFDSTINGAFDSADIAADLLLDYLKVPPRSLSSEYFDYYSVNSSYDKSYKVAFDAKYVRDLIRAAWNVAPPYRLLDAGSANGLTITRLQRLGIDAWGIENNWYIHGQTPRKLRKKNFLGDVCNLPFPDQFFDFVYETCLAYVPEHQLQRAIQELARVTRKGVFLGSIVTDLKPKVVRRYQLNYGVNSLLGLKQWCELFESNGFRLAVTDPKITARLWRIEKKACGGEKWYRSAESLSRCFYEKSWFVSQTSANNGRRALS